VDNCRDVSQERFLDRISRQLNPGLLPGRCRRMLCPGVAPHPRRHAGWHSFGQPEPTLSVPAPDQWQTDDAYRYGVDLYNFAFVVGMS
jgi:hypothetical protein